MGHCLPQRGRRVAERAVGRPKLTGESSRLVPPPGRHAGQARWCRTGGVVHRPPEGQQPLPQSGPSHGEGRLVSAAGCLYPTSLSSQRLWFVPGRAWAEGTGAASGQ